MHGARFHLDQTSSRDRARRPVSATLSSRTFVLKDNEMARCKNALVRGTRLAVSSISVTDLITERSHGMTCASRLRLWTSPQIAPIPRGTSDHRGAVMDGEIGWIMSSRSTGNGGSC